MALWGNSDNVGSIGTVTLDYSNRVVSGWAGTATGLGVSFGESGYAQVGDTISFGQHGTGTYFGEAIIASIGSTLQVTIASTIGLSGEAIAGVNYTISEKPTWIPTDSHWNVQRDAAPTIQKLSESTTSGASGIGSQSIQIDISAISPPVQVGDYIINNSENYEIKAIGYSTAVAIATCITNDKVFRAEPPDWITEGTTTVGLGTTRPIVNQVGFVTADVGGAGIAVLKGSAVIPVKEILTYHLMVGDVVNIGAAITDVAIASIAHTTVSLASTTPVNINVGTMVSFSSSTFNVFATPGNNDETIAVGDSITYGEGQNASLQFPAGGNDVIDLDQALAETVASGAAVTFRRSVNGYDAYAYGVSGIGASSALASSKQYITNAGWVGVTTYLDNLGNLRVKKETLVAMSGITTGNAPAYPPHY